MPGADALIKLSETLDVDLNWLLLDKKSNYDVIEKSEKIDLFIFEEIATTIIFHIKKMRDESEKDMHYELGSVWLNTGMVYNKIIGEARSRQEQFNLIEKEVAYLFDIFKYNITHDKTEMIHEAEQEYIRSEGLQFSDVTDKKVVNDKSTVTQNFNSKVGQAAAGDIHNHRKKK
jgi:hypothetical protein